MYNKASVNDVWREMLILLEALEEYCSKLPLEETLAISNLIAPLVDYAFDTYKSNDSDNE